MNVMATARKAAKGSRDSGDGNKALPTPAEWEQSQRDWQWFHENKAALLEQYPEQWIAVMDERVIVHEAGLGEFMRALSEADDPKGLAVREFVTAQEPLWMLGHWPAPQ